MSNQNNQIAKRETQQEFFDMVLHKTNESFPLALALRVNGLTPGKAFESKPIAMYHNKDDVGYAILRILSNFTQQLNLTNPMSPAQLAEAAAILMKEYSTMTLEEMSLAFRMQTLGRLGVKLYSALDIAKICEILNAYLGSPERCEYIESRHKRSSEQNESLERSSSPEEIAKYIEQLKQTVSSLGGGHEGFRAASKSSSDQDYQRVKAGVSRRLSDAVKDNNPDEAIFALKQSLLGLGVTDTASFIVSLCKDGKMKFSHEPAIDLLKVSILGKAVSVTLRCDPIDREGLTGLVALSVSEWK